VQAALVPELYVSDLDASLIFYARVGFVVRYARPAERFAYLAREGAELMLEEPSGRIWLSAPLVRPFGRGMNLQIAAADVEALYAIATSAELMIQQPLEVRDYARAADVVRIRQFVVADPDGYLLRFSQMLDVSPAPPPATP